MNESPPTFHYTRAAASDEGEPEVRARTERLTAVLTWIVLAICLGVWAIVGALFWVPLLFRRIVKFSFALVPAILADRKPEQAAKMLRDAVSFYRRGFQVATELVARGPEATDRPDRIPEDSSLRGVALLNELAWILVIWYAILFFVGVVHTTPLDMWRWLAGISWAGVFRHVTGFIRSLRP